MKNENHRFTYKRIHRPKCKSIKQKRRNRTSSRTYGTKWKFK